MCTHTDTHTLCQTDSWKVFFRLCKPQPSQTINHYVYDAPEVFECGTSRFFDDDDDLTRKVFICFFINSVGKIS